eukprot:TRINITY_DN12615_c0_g1_i1.p1 TRINITY_DN12615_c0_g1~~TRINITY_DN12615_c0_g1_i1.p1  ORF type:complete len:682 (-),score=133.49 TRINITY_DN12615_c0_g1_i1:84-2129(-)
MAHSEKAGEQEYLEFVTYTSLAFLMLAGYLMSRLAWAFRLPPVLGMLFCGILFDQMGEYLPMLEGLHEVQMRFAPFMTDLTFFLVLVRAGLEIDFSEIRLLHLLFGALPVCFDAVGVALAALAIGVASSPVHAGMIGFLMSCLGDGLVIPKMMELQSAFKERGRMPRLMFVAAPIEATVALTFFGLFLGLASPGRLSASSRLGVAFGRLAATVVLSRVVTWILAWLVRPDLESGPRLKVRGREIFAGHDLEDALLLFCTAFGLFSVAHLLPNGLDESGLLQPELCAIMCAAFYGNSMSRTRRRVVEVIFGRLWVAFSLLLFTVLGTKVDFRILGDTALTVLPLLLAGLFCRGLAVGPLVFLTRGSRTCRGIQGGSCEYCHADNTANWTREAFFALLVGLPRATVQGALATAAMKAGAFEGTLPQEEALAQQVKMGRLAISTLAICAPCGVILLDFLGQRLLRTSTCTCQEALLTGPAASATFLNVAGQLPRSVSSRRSSLSGVSFSTQIAAAGRSSPTMQNLNARTFSRRPTDEVARAASLSLLSEASQQYLSSSPAQEVKADFFDLLAGLPPQASPCASLMDAMGLEEATTFTSMDSDAFARLRDLQAKDGQLGSTTSLGCGKLRPIASAGCFIDQMHDDDAASVTEVCDTRGAAPSGSADVETGAAASGSGGSGERSAG